MATIPALPQPFAALALELVDFCQHYGDVFLLLLEQRTPPGKHLQKLDELRPLAAGRIVEIQKLANLRQRQSKALAAQDELDADPLALPIHSALPVSSRRKQPLVLVEANGPGG